MFNNYDSSQIGTITNDHFADGQCTDGMNHFSLPMYDPWQSSIDFMLWPPGSCEYGCHVAACPNTPTAMNPKGDDKAEDIARSPFSTVHSHTVNNMSYYQPCTTPYGNTCPRRCFTSRDNHFYEQPQTFRTKDIPMTTPVWRPSGPLPRFSEKL